MAEESERIRERIEQTRGRLTASLASLESDLRGAVETTVSDVTAAVKRLSPVHQTRRHPLTAVACTVLAGTLVGRWASSRRTPLLASVRRGFEPELRTFRSVLVATALRGLRSYLSDSDRTRRRSVLRFPDRTSRASR